ncbi:MAG: type II toxin-antitoxin system VapC family toxin [Geminicoccaceae bacterium]
MGDAALILADTQALVWYAVGDERLGVHARSAIAEAVLARRLLVSAISFCEVAWLHRAGRLDLASSPSDWRRSILGEKVREVPIDGAIAVAAAELVGFHKDPADRLIVATALHEQASIITSDRQILDWAGILERIDARV